MDGSRRPPRRRQQKGSSRQRSSAADLAGSAGGGTSAAAPAAADLPAESSAWDRPDTDADLPDASEPRDPPRHDAAILGSDPPFARQLSRRLALWVTVFSVGSAACFFHAAAHQDCTRWAYLVGTWCLIWAVLRFLMWCSSRVEARLSRIGIFKLGFYSTMALMGVISVLKAVVNAAGTYPYCSAEVQADEARLRRVASMGLPLAMVAMECWGGHLMAIELFPFMWQTLCVQAAQRSASPEPPSDVESAAGTTVGGWATVNGWWRPITGIVASQAFIIKLMSASAHRRNLPDAQRHLGIWSTVCVSSFACSVGLTTLVLQLWFMGRHILYGGPDEPAVERVPAALSAVECVGDAAQKDKSTNEADETDELEGTECVVCLDAQKSHVIFPCGHRCVCGACATALIGQPCPLCRIPCQTSCKVYL